jgi:hypothetical protein
MDLALVGLVAPDIENRSLDVLARAVRDAKMSVSIVPYSGWPDLQRAIGDVLHLDPKICGVSLQTSESALAVLSFTRLLRGRGYQGRIVCGGHFATLNAEDILAAPTGVDVVVRFAGEEALVGMLRRPNDEAYLSTLPGVMYRSRMGGIRTGAPARIQTSNLLSKKKTERALPLHLGFPAADVVFSQGCEAHCSYCCIAGKGDLARSETTRVGSARSSPVHSRASIDDIADELSTLFHEHGARIFNFMDDNILPLAPDDVAGWANELRSALERRRVRQVAFSIQVRGDAIHEKSARALAKLGIVRAYVGVDGYSTSQLKELGRSSPPDAGRGATARLWEQGIYTVVNSLLIGPTIQFESVMNEIEGFEQIGPAPIHLLPIEARAGSAYFRRAQSLGLLEGGFMMWQYRFLDERTQRMGQMMMGFPTRLEERSVPIGLYDLGYNLGVARRLVEGIDLSHLTMTYEEIARDWNQDQNRLLRAAADAAQSADSSATKVFIASQLECVTAHDRALLDRCDQAIHEVERAVARFLRGPVRAHSRGKILGAVALSMSLAGCVTPSAHPDGGASEDAGWDGGEDAGWDGGEDAGTTADGGPCQITDAGTFYDPRNGQLAHCIGFCRGLYVTFDSSGFAVSFSTSPDGGTLPDGGIQDCLQAYFSRCPYPSYAGTTQHFNSHCWLA